MKPASSLADQMEGVIVRLEKDGKTLREYVYPSSLRLKWDDLDSLTTASN